MKPYYEDEAIRLLHGDCLDMLRSLPDASVDSVVTDPPYGLGFMGKEWDDLPPGLPFAVECLRVLKPGGHLLAFGGTRTWHRLACAVEDAGFEIRDSIAWMYGSGFPKSLDVSKAIDKGSGENRAREFEFTAWMRSTGITAKQIDIATGTRMGGHYTTHPTQPAIATAEMFDRLRPLLPVVPERIERLVAERTGISWTNYAKRPITGRGEKGRRVQSTWGEGSVTGVFRDGANGYDERSIPVTPDAERWQGWGTALKPAFEPIVVARKPLIGTVAANVLTHGTGALNVDGCRVGDESTRRSNAAEMGYHGGNLAGAYETGSTKGRWPANVILDESQADALDGQSGELTSGANPTRRSSDKFRDAYGDFAGQEECTPARGADSGGASRFFYVAKADASERVRVDGIAHPTVKPLTLMRWLVRLVTPPGGTVLEPFAGSGTTVEACLLEGLQCIAIEREADYLPLIVQRINRRRDPVAAIKATGDDAGLFELLEGEGA